MERRLGGCGDVPAPVYRKGDGKSDRRISRPRERCDVGDCPTTQLLGTPLKWVPFLELWELQGELPSIARFSRPSLEL